MRKILLLAANPKESTRRRLDQEVRDITEGLERARHRDEFHIAQRWAVRPRDFQRAMQNELPQIVHFSGQGQGKAGLYFEDNKGLPKLVNGKALASLFKLFAQKSKIECVVLNGCYSQVQAEAIVKYIPYVIGMKQSVDDRSVIEFAVGFYDALGNGASVEFAFEAGKVAMALNGTGNEEIPVLLSKRTKITRNTFEFHNNNGSKNGLDNSIVERQRNSKPQLKSESKSSIKMNIEQEHASRGNDRKRMIATRSISRDHLRSVRDQSSQDLETQLFNHPPSKNEINRFLFFVRKTAFLQAAILVVWLIASSFLSGVTQKEITQILFISGSFAGIASGLIEGLCFKLLYPSIKAKDTFIRHPLTGLCFGVASWSSVGMILGTQHMINNEVYWFGLISGIFTVLLSFLYFSRLVNSSNWR